MPPPAWLNEEALQQLAAEQKPTLDILQQLRAFNIAVTSRGLNVVLIGDQSCGKSTVFSAILGFPFPTNGGTSNKFIVEIFCRRAKSSTTPSFEVHSRLSEGDGVAKSRMKLFNEGGSNLVDLPATVEKAIMAMSGNTAETPHSAYCLLIQLWGPELPNLYIMDLPNSLSSCCDEGSTEAGLLPKELKILKSPSTVILAVVSALSAQDGIATPGAITQAKTYDPKGERTLGILTKPDLAMENGLECQRKWPQLVRDNRITDDLVLGWHVLQSDPNVSGDPMNSKRDKAECEFFSSGTWSEISPQNRGSSALRKKLSKAIAIRTQSSLPAILPIIEQRIKERQIRLTKLGKERLGIDDMRSHLFRTAGRFHALAVAAIRGDYSDGFFTDGSEPGTSPSLEDGRVRRLRALIQDLQDAFGFVLSTGGAQRRLSSDSFSLHTVEPQPADHLSPLVGLYPRTPSPKVSFKSFIVELEERQSKSQASDQLLATQLFREQISPWERIARTHIQIAHGIVRSFTEGVLSDIVGPDKHLFAALVKRFLDPFLEAKWAEMDTKLTEVLQYYQKGLVQPLEAGTFSGDQCVGKRRKISTSAWKELTEVPDHSHMERILTNTVSYYEASLKVFKNNVDILAIENCLISKIPDILAPDTIYELSKEGVEQIVAHAPDPGAKREETTKELEVLKSALETFKRGQTETAIFPLALFRTPKQEEKLSGITGTKSQALSVRIEDELATNEYLLGIPTEGSTLTWEGPPVLPAENPNNLNAFQCLVFYDAAAKWSQDELRFKHYLVRGRTREAGFTGAYRN